MHRAPISLPRFLLVFPILLHPSSVWAESLCNSNEQIVFSCPLQQGKLVSVCAHQSRVDYRYGRPARPELILSDPGATRPFAARHYHYFRAGVNRNSLRFETADALYTVFSETEEPAHAAAGVTVILKKNEREFTLSCTASHEAHWYRIEGRLACSDEALNACVPPGSP